MPPGLGSITLSPGTTLVFTTTADRSFKAADPIADTLYVTHKTIAGSGIVIATRHSGTNYGSGYGATASLLPDDATLVMDGGTFSPGIGSATGALGFRGNLNLSNASGSPVSLNIKVASASLFDSLNVSTNTAGSEMLGLMGQLTGLENSNLVLNIARSGWASYVGAELPIITAANDLSAASFASVTWQNNTIGQVNYKNGSITLTHVGLAGDGNNDGSIDATDYANWFNNVGVSVTPWTNGDFNGDGAVDATDYALWFNNVGAGVSAGPVPEPATMTLLVLGGLAILRRRK
jgi:hypothetical protein